MADFDIWIGTTKLDSLDWRAVGEVADDDEEDATEASPEVVSFLGFDPFAADEVDPDSVDGDSATTATDETANAFFDKAKQKYRELQDVAHEASERLREAAGPEKGPMGLTPEHIRLSPAYRRLKMQYDKAANELKTYATWYVKQFKKELQAERRHPDYHKKRQAEANRRNVERSTEVPIMASVEEVANAKIRSLKRLPRKMASVQKPINTRKRDAALNKTKPGMKFLHRTEVADGKPAEMKIFAVKGGSIYYDETAARKPGFYCDPVYFFSKVLKEWVR